MSAALSLIFCLAPLAPQAGPSDRKVDFKARFGRFDGCFVIRQIGGDWSLRYNEEGCATAHSPCSTFKIFNALAGLDCGVLAGPQTAMKWDGKPQRIKTWERDHTLATAIRDSVVWYFQEVARLIGDEKMRGYLQRAEYGNRSTGGAIDRFWLDGSLTISANQQAVFMERLYTDKLPFKKSVMKTVRELIVLREGEGWTFSGKTGTKGEGDRAVLGWFVGHVRSGNSEYVFATNIRAAEGGMGQTAKEIAFSILTDLGLVRP